MWKWNYPLDLPCLNRWSRRTLAVISVKEMTTIERMVVQKWGFRGKSRHTFFRIIPRKKHVALPGCPTCDMYQLEEAPEWDTWWLGEAPGWDTWQLEEAPQSHTWRTHEIPRGTRVTVSALDCDTCHESEHPLWLYKFSQCTICLHGFCTSSYVICTSFVRFSHVFCTTVAKICRN